MPGDLDHLRWQRLDIESVLKPKTPPPPPRPRTNRGEHAQALDSKSTLAFDAIHQDRRRQGIAPDRLLVLRMRFLDATQRELLAKLGLRILDEREERVPLSAPVYEVQVEFPTSAAAEAIRHSPNLASYGIASLAPELGPNATIHPTRLVFQFSDRDQAKRCCESDRGGIPIPFEVRGAPNQQVKTVKETKAELATIQFRDQFTKDGFYRELQANRNHDDQAHVLTRRERSILFDALESVARISPDQRRGSRLVQEGLLGDGELVLDVDLWHPGTVELAREAEAQFRAVVERFGGRVTGTLRPILQTLMIARVRGSRQLLDELLTYDRVSRIDLPPIVELNPTTIFQHSPVMADPIQIPLDGPLACVVDSGVVSGHPLLRDLVVDEEDFDSGEDTPVDLAGHGTEVAGVVAYGDLRASLESGSWVPKVRLINAKVMKARRDWNGNVIRAEFAGEERAETQIANAITRFATDPDRRCRVFNLSIGNENFVLNHGHQLPWALLLDELARMHDIVIVVSAGNVASPEVPPTPSTAEFQQAIREQILDDVHALIDPASAINVLTVGSIARHEVPHQRSPNENRPDLVAAPKNCPSPFTRTGLLKPNGSGACRTVKPELVAFGGNYSLSTDGRWNPIDFALAEPVLNFNHTQRLLRYSSGTSIAAPYVTHVCAITEHRLRQLNGNRPVSANLIRAFVAHGALVPPEAANWLNAGHTESESLKRCLRAIGYGRPDPSRSCYSTDNRVLLYSEDQIAERHFHLYQLELPSEFIAEKGHRVIRATLAFDPPVRGTRLEYQSRAMTMQLIRGVSTDEIRTALAKLDGDAANIALPARAKRFQPTLFEWSTLQSQVSASANKSSFISPKDDAANAYSWHLLVGCKHRFEVDDTDIPQRYAVVLSLEHSKENIRLYQVLKNQLQVAAQIRVQRGR